MGVLIDGDPLLSSSLSVMALARAAVASGSSEGQKSSESVSVLPLSSSKELRLASPVRDFFPVKKLLMLMMKVNVVVSFFYRSLCSDILIISFRFNLEIILLFIYAC